jgi:hypothetical protein
MVFFKYCTEWVDKAQTIEDYIQNMNQYMSKSCLPHTRGSTGNVAPLLYSAL